VRCAHAVRAGEDNQARGQEARRLQSSRAIACGASGRLDDDVAQRGHSGQDDRARSNAELEGRVRAGNDGPAQSDGAAASIAAAAVERGARSAAAPWRRAKAGVSPCCSACAARSTKALSRAASERAASRSATDPGRCCAHAGGAPAGDGAPAGAKADAGTTAEARNPAIRGQRAAARATTTGAEGNSAAKARGPGADDGSGREKAEAKPEASASGGELGRRLRYRQARAPGGRDRQAWAPGDLVCRCMHDANRCPLT
jgi:hypothetical protein